MKIILRAYSMALLFEAAAQIQCLLAVEDYFTFRQDLPQATPDGKYELRLAWEGDLVADWTGNSAIEMAQAALVNIHPERWGEAIALIPFIRGGRREQAG